MNWLQLLYDILEVCIISLFGLLTAYAVKFIKIKSDNIKENIKNDTAGKYVDMLAATISDCVVATNQTYVEALKKENAFTAKAQKEAFELTYDAVMRILTEDAKEYLEAVYGDLSVYIKMKIEAEVNLNK